MESVHAPETSVISPLIQGFMAPETSVPLRLKHVDVIERILRPKIAGEALDPDVAALVRYADFYSDTPEKVFAIHKRPGPHDHWYFLTHAHYRNGRKQKRRPCGLDGWWRGFTRREVVNGDNGLVGYRRHYNYRVNKVEKTDWVMVEYTVPQDQQDDGKQWVLCKIHNFAKHSDQCEQEPSN